MVCQWSLVNGLLIALPKGRSYVSRLVIQRHFTHLRPPPATDNYQLTRDSEFKIDEAIRRAKVTGRTLFKGHTFYISRQAKSNFAMLEKVIKAAGGQVNACAIINTTFTLTHC